MLQPVAFNDLRNFIKGRIAQAQYQVESTWYDATIVESVITGTGIVRIKCQIAHGAACTITGARLVSTTNDVWLAKDISVIIDSASTNLLVWFDFNVTESEVS